MTTEPVPQPLPPAKIAFIIDGIVTEVLHTEDRMAAIFLSEPTILDVTEWYATHEGEDIVNTYYDGVSFTRPDVDGSVVA